MTYVNSTESTKTPYLLHSENIPSTIKPPRFKRNIQKVSTPRESVQLKSRNYLPERHNSLDKLNLEDLNKPKLSSTQSVKNLSGVMEVHTFRENRKKDISEMQKGMNHMIDMFKQQRSKDL